MLEHPIKDQRAWDAASLDDKSTWYHHLPVDVAGALAATIADLRRRPRPTTDLRLADTLCAVLAGAFRAALEDLENGRGFIILRGLPSDGCSPAEITAMYWLVGQMLGRPFVQNVQGTLLYDVKDTGQ